MGGGALNRIDYWSVRTKFISFCSSGYVPTVPSATISIRVHTRKFRRPTWLRYTACFYRRGAELELGWNFDEFTPSQVAAGTIHFSSLLREEGQFACTRVDAHLLAPSSLATRAPASASGNASANASAKALPRTDPRAVPARLVTRLAMLSLMSRTSSHLI